MQYFRRSVSIFSVFLINQLQSSNVCSAFSLWFRFFFACTDTSRSEQNNRDLLDDIIQWFLERNCSDQCFTKICSIAFNWHHRKSWFVFKWLLASQHVCWHVVDPATLRWRHNGRDSVTIIYSTVYSDTDQRKHQSSASLVFVWGIHRGQVNSPHKWPVTRKMFPFDDVITNTSGGWQDFPDNKVHGANMGPTWDRQDPGGPHVGHINLVIGVYLATFSMSATLGIAVRPIWQRGALKSHFVIIKHACVFVYCEPNIDIHFSTNISKAKYHRQCLETTFLASVSPFAWRRIILPSAGTSCILISTFNLVFLWYWTMPK